MSFTAGQYYIRNKGTEAFVQRALNEDKSLNPKSVIAVPPGVEAHLWSIERNGDSYVLKADGAPAFPKNNLVFVSLLEDSVIDLKWKITAVPQAGRNVFLIESTNQRGGWVLPSEQPFAQVAFRPLIIGPSDPPFYPPSQLWIITPLVD
ncbi:hypothetical protein K443DRAFT_682351 [Laccaria amethystina LaAM-08-1]|uniref:Ricin B lectin domain-containing protein n=1 Tax=Laccaria amethystina LaAM-08-1 TaxID=1095629 RepID=A0A0C9WVC8_9AGAR|nr:hypothetical protein K443DRAFT_682351 [Laccaria amethystina LaAM-08-1]